MCSYIHTFFFALYLNVFVNYIYNNIYLKNVRLCKISEFLSTITALRGLSQPTPDYYCFDRVFFLFLCAKIHHKSRQNRCILWSPKEFLMGVTTIFCFICTFLNFFLRCYYPVMVHIWAVRQVSFTKVNARMSWSKFKPNR